LGKEGEGQGAGGQEEDPDPERPMAETVDRCIVIAELSLVRIFNFSAVFHCLEFRSRDGGASTPGIRDQGLKDQEKQRMSENLKN
jgi:hypothetical protein